jgi:energy-coupling factor transporter ATP-binding protein EcfA2
MLSGGERNKAGLSLLFGMRDLKEKYTGLSTNVLILDEPFGNLDAYGTECLLSVLESLKDRFGTIFVIGNQHDVLTHEIWDQVWWAVRENNEARLYREGLPSRYNDAVARYAARQYNDAAL